MFKKILSKVLTVLLIILALLCCTVMAKKAMGKEPTVLGCRVFYIVTGSMEPTIPVGAAVLTHKDAGNNYEVGDVITFKAAQEAISGQPNTHRIVAKDMVDGQPVYTTKGDANNSIDAEPVYGKNVYGKVIWSSGSMKWIGTFMGMVTTPMGFFACIIIPVLVIAGIMAKDFAKSYKAAMEEDAKEKIEKEMAAQLAAQQAAQTAQSPAAETAQQAAQNPSVETAQNSAEEIPQQPEPAEKTEPAEKPEPAEKTETAAKTDA